MRVLAIDPSGSFDEGKGTTGWSIIEDAPLVHVVMCGEIKAVAFKTAEAYWEAHCEILLQLYRTQHVEAVVMEAYVLYESTARAQINSSFETSQLIGVIKHLCAMQGIPCHTQRAVDVKRRWANEILAYKEIIQPVGKGFHINGHRVSGHIIDSVRHGVHYIYFGGKHASHNKSGEANYHSQDKGAVRRSSRGYVNSFSRRVRPLS